MVNSLWRLSQGHWEFEASLGYNRVCLQREERKEGKGEEKKVRDGKGKIRATGYGGAHL